LSKNIAWLTVVSRVNDTVFSVIFLVV